MKHAPRHANARGPLFAAQERHSTSHKIDAHNGQELEEPHYVHNNVHNNGKTEMVSTLQLQVVLKIAPISPQGLKIYARVRTGPLIRENYIPQILTAYAKHHISGRQFLDYKRTKRLKHVKRFLTLGISFHRNLTQKTACRGS